jgi:hypothetical protein
MRSMYVEYLVTWKVILDGRAGESLLALLTSTLYLNIEDKRNIR